MKVHWLHQMQAIDAWTALRVQRHTFFMGNILASFYVFAIVHHQGRFLAIRERKGSQGWYAPAGRLEAGETIEEAAVRETMEEAGILVEPTALLRLDQQWYPSEAPGQGPRAWMRFIMSARPVGPERMPKSFADEHSLEARWLTLAELERLPLRHPEVLSLFALSTA
jgi:phosphatase NudJ